MTREPINELKLNLLGKIFFTAAAAWVVGKACNLMVRGTMDEVKAVQNALLATRRFQEELNHPAATVDSVMQQLSLKHAAATQFETIIGIPFPLTIIMLIGAGHVAFNFFSSFTA